jgi:radical SAM superfamily enzyme YgiQ (UPF0313 family)
MRYQEPVFRPPSEADSLIFQATVGCSHNTCTFCAMYRNKRFEVRPLDEMLDEIAEAGRLWPETARVFLADGDALAAPTEHLMEILRALSAAFPKLRRVSLYATPLNLLSKVPEELRALAGAGLTLFYVGLESGSDAVLRRAGKGIDAASAVEAIRRGQEAGLRSSVMVLLGLGGSEGSEEHALATARAVNAIQPHYLSVLAWFPVPEAPLFRQMVASAFSLPGDLALIRELGMLVGALDLKDTVFRANHASNPLPIGGRLSRDTLKILSAIRAAERGSLPLRPAYLRGV